MSARIRQHLRANVVGYVALFVALSGSAYAVNGPLEGKNTVGTADIINEEVRAADVANRAVRGGEVLDESLTGVEIANDNVGDFNDATQDAINADQVGGVEEEDLVRKFPTTSEQLSGLRYRAFFLRTAESADELPISLSLSIENVGSADQFRLCSSAPKPAVVVLSGGTTTTTMQPSIPDDGCSTNITIPDDGAFQISGDRSQVWGVHSGNIEDLYLVYVLHAA